MTDVQRTRFASIRERLHAEVTLMPSGCLVWRAAPDGADGSYGYTYYKGKRVVVHRLAWEAEHGPISGGLTIDHVRGRGCIYKRCINLDHLELVSRSENSRRGALHRWDLQGRSPRF